MIKTLVGCSSNNGLVFTTQWKTDNAGTSTSTQITFPTHSTGTYNCTVFWGDGTTSVITTFNDAAWTHTYSVAGTYIVKITGTMTGLSFNGGGDRLKLLKIITWGPFTPVPIQGQFSGCANLTVTATDTMTMGAGTFFTQFFANCTSLTRVPSFNTWNLSNVTNFGNFFLGCTSFNQTININVSASTTFGSFLSGCSSFNSPVTINAPLANSYANMFLNCSIFNSPISINGVPTSTIGMFSGCTAFNQDVSSINTASVTNATNMFLNCANFNQSVSSFNTANVTTMASMFLNCTNFNQSVSSFNTAKVTSMSAMFQTCTNFNQDVSAFDIRALTNATNMFLNSGFNITNYNLLLDSVTGWPSQATIQNTVTFSAGTAHYSGANAIAGRAVLTAGHSWSISDGGTP